MNSAHSLHARDVLTPIQHGRAHWFSIEGSQVHSPRERESFLTLDRSVEASVAEHPRSDFGRRLPRPGQALDPDLGFLPVRDGADSDRLREADGRTKRDLVYCK